MPIPIGKSPRDVAWKIVAAMRSEFVGRRRDPSDDDWVELIERTIDPLLGPDDRYEEGYDDGYDEGYEDAADEERKTREGLRRKKRAEKAEVASKRRVLVVNTTS